MGDCEFYIPSRRTCSAGIEHLRTCCSLTGEPCLIDEDIESDRLQCDRRQWVRGYMAGLVYQDTKGDEWTLEYKP